MRFITGSALALLLSSPLGCVQRGSTDAPIGRTLEAPSDLFDGERDGFGRTLAKDHDKSSTVAASASSAKEADADAAETDGEKLDGDESDGEEGFYVRRGGSADVGGGDSDDGGLTEVEGQDGGEAPDFDGGGDAGDAPDIEGADGGDGGDEE